MSIKRVIIYDKSRVQPKTIEALLAAKDGECVPVDRSELGAFETLTFDEEKAVSLKPPKPPQGEKQPTDQEKADGQGSKKRLVSRAS